MQSGKHHENLEDLISKDTRFRGILGQVVGAMHSRRDFDKESPRIRLSLPI